MKIRFLLLIAVIILLILLAACQSPTAVPVVQTAIPTQLAVLTAAPTSPPTPSSDEIRTLAAHALLFTYIRPNRMDVTTTSGGNTSTNAIEFVPPDRKHIIGDPVEFIIIGDKVYDTTAGKGKWGPSQYPASTFMGGPIPTEQGIADTISSPIFVRKDTLNGKTVVVVSFNGIDHFNGQDLHRQTELWIGEADGLPYKMNIDGEIASVSTDSSSGTSSLQVVKSFSSTLLTFGANIQIEAPIQ